MANKKQRGQIPRQGQKSEKDIMETFPKARPRDDLRSNRENAFFGGRAVNTAKNRHLHQNRG